MHTYLVSLTLVVSRVLALSSVDPVADYGGHSRDFHLLHHQESDQAWETVSATWHKSSHHMSRRDVGQQPSLDEIKEFIETFKPAFKSAQETITKMVNHSAVLTGRLKSAVSLQEKLVRKNETLDGLRDVIGLRLTCQTVNETIRIKDLILADTKNFNVTEVICYGICPGAGKYRPSTGYRRIHLIIYIKNGGKFAELQIGTPYTNMWSDWNHDFIYKVPKDISNDPKVGNYSLAMAEYFWKLDEDRKILPPCPSKLTSADPLKILKEGVAGDHADQVLMKLGYPPNACFWWNDMKLALPEKECSISAAASPVAGIASFSTVLLSLVGIMFISW